MSEELEAKKLGDTDRYWNGVFTGVFIGSFFISLLILFVVRFQGLQIAINPDKLAALVQDKVQMEARKSMPQILEEIKHELPKEIDKNFTSLDDLNISIGQTQVKLPPEAINAIKSEFNRIIESAVINTINGYSTTQYEKRIGESAYQMMNNILRQEVIGKTYLIKASEWLSVPVKIVGTSKLPVKVGI